MPIGNPIFTTEKELDKIFGFVYAVITPPSEDVLKVASLQARINGKVENPREIFERWIFSEELKSALKEGYTADIICGYKFKRGILLFDKYVDMFYELKKNSKNPVERGMSKLMLNSLYGKFGMKDINSILRIISKEQSDKLNKSYNYTMLSDLGYDKVLVKYNSRISEKLRLLLKEEAEELNLIKDDGLVNVKGVPSAIQIAAAISGYARISINKYKNIPGNNCFYSDTDSVILQKELDNNLVGYNIGQMKLEFDIEQGFLIRKKLYALKNKEGIVKIAAAGTDKKCLNFKDFEDLSEGKEILTNRTSFKVDWKNLNVNIVKEEINLKGIKQKDCVYNESGDIGQEDRIKKNLLYKDDQVKINLRVQSNVLNNDKFKRGYHSSAVLNREDSYNNLIYFNDDKGKEIKKDMIKDIKELISVMNTKDFSHNLNINEQKKSKVLEYLCNNNTNLMGSVLILKNKVLDNKGELNYSQIVLIFIDLRAGRIGVQQYITGNVNKEIYFKFFKDVYIYIVKNRLFDKKRDNRKYFSEGLWNSGSFMMWLIINKLKYFSSEDSERFISIPKGIISENVTLGKNKGYTKIKHLNSFNENPQIVKDLKAKINAVKPWNEDNLSKVYLDFPKFVYIKISKMSDGLYFSPKYQAMLDEFHRKRYTYNQKAKLNKFI